MLQMGIFSADQRFHCQWDGQIRGIPSSHDAGKFRWSDTDDREGSIVEVDLFTNDGRTFTESALPVVEAEYDHSRCIWPIILFYDSSTQPRPHTQSCKIASGYSKYTGKICLSIRSGVYAIQPGKGKQFCE